ncbi:hypothetical protein K474DRAFT_398426 [Panus rudis PR-1116 ss-1]|nr:hypothetical protein K474DRAFT_398426 [Panus rudis PR-1116 ss-1]
MTDSVKQTALSSVNSEYARRRKQHLALINQLRAIGAQADLDLPRIAVIGNQSAGKSSLVEAISGINVPRDAGTCTRCPMECRLSHSSGSWLCQVYLRIEFKENGERVDEVREVPFGNVISNKEDVELALRQAQAAILNPKIPSRKFLEMSADDLREHNHALRFSRNTVCIDLQGPELTELAFVDLPGIIQNADAEIVQLVEDMVLQHIRGNCLILVTLPMSDDIENQKAMRLAQQVDPVGSRTIGVLTKPDTLTAGATKSRALWLEVIEGRRAQLRHGYYCTRQPDDDERTKGITPIEARKAEQEFFAKTAPWCNSSAKGKFGTQNLIASLSRLLSAIIDESIPKLRTEVDRQLKLCTERLSQLPAPITSEPSSYVLQLITSFCDEIARHVHGDSFSPELVQLTRRIYAAYKKDVRSSAPQFLPFVNAAEVNAANVSLKGYLDLDDEEDEMEVEDDQDGDVNGIDFSSGKPIFLPDVRRHIERSITRELPGNVPYSAKTALIKQCQETWELDSQKCYREVYRALEAALLRMSEKTFGQFDNLKSIMQRCLKELIDIRGAETLSEIKMILKRETVPFTQNDHYMQVTKSTYLAKYKGARAGQTELADAPRSEKRRKVTLDGAADGSVGDGNKSRGPETPSSSTSTTTSSPQQPQGSGRPSFFGQSQTASSQQQTQNNSRPVAGKQPNGGLFGQSNANAGLSTFSFEPTTPFGKPFGAHTSSTTTASTTTPSSTARPTAFSSTIPSSTVTPTPFSFAPAPPAPKQTQNDSNSASVNLRAELINQFKKRTHAADDEKSQEAVRTILANLAFLGLPGITEDDLAKLVPPDPYEREMDVMAEVRAYFQVAYKRIIDNVPMTIDHSFLFEFSSTLQSYLIEKLGLGSENATSRCSAYLAEDPTIVAEREELLAKKKRLISVQNELYQYGFS